MWAYKQYSTYLFQLLLTKQDIDNHCDMLSDQQIYLKIIIEKLKGLFTPYLHGEKYTKKPCFDNWGKTISVELILCNRI